MADTPGRPVTSASADTESSTGETPLEVDAHDIADDTDSAYGGSIVDTISTTLHSSVVNYQYENGRRYHAYRSGEYFLPNDEVEQDRLDLQHHVYRLCVGGALHRAPIVNPRRVLDIGTGTGIWAIEFADEYPDAQVIGTDLSPIQPGFVPPNVNFYVDDFEQPWEFGGAKFDFVHWRSLLGSTADWPKLYGQARDNLEPGGWLEVQEYHAWIFSDDDSVERAPWIMSFCQNLDEASTLFGKRMNVAASHRQWMEEAGFVDVKEEVYKVPVGTWARDPKLKEIGRYELLHAVGAAAESHGSALWTRVLNKSIEDARISFAKVRQEFADRSLHLYTMYRFIYGRKAR